MGDDRAPWRVRQAAPFEEKEAELDRAFDQGARDRIMNDAINGKPIDLGALEVAFEEYYMN